MIFRILVVTIQIALCSASAVYSQDKKHPDKYEVEQWIYEDQQRQVEAQREMLIALNTPSPPRYLDKFLSSDSDSWVVSIIAEGGILGGTRVLNAMNSAGDFICNLNGADFQTEPAKQKTFETVSRLVRSQLSTSEKPSSAKQASIKNCHDCSFEYLAIYQRQNVSVVSRRYAASVLGVELKALYSLMAELKACPAK